MPADNVEQFIQEHTARVAPIAKEIHVAYWNATTTGKREHFDRYAELELELRTLYSNKEEFECVQTWANSDSPRDDIEKRQIEILYRSYLRNQLSHDLIGRMTRLSSDIVSRFNTYRAQVEGKTITSNGVRDILRDSEDSEYRRRVWEADKRVGTIVEKDLLDLVRMRNESARSLGYANYYSMSLELAEQNERDLIELFDELDELTRKPFASEKKRVDAMLAKRFSVAPEDLRAWHYEDPFFQEAPRIGTVDFDTYYEKTDILDLVREYFRGIGLEVSDIIDRSDLYEKPGKEQHAYCLDVDREGDIRVLANIRNDETWAGTMLHELGHAVYDDCIDPTLPYLLREHAHVFTTEAIAMLFGRLSKNAKWMAATIGIDTQDQSRLEQAGRESQRVSQLVFSRWCQVMVRFERTLYADPEQDLSATWWDLVSRYQMITPPDGRREPDWASKIHVVTAPVYYHNYMLGELLASQLDNHIHHNLLEGSDAGALAGSAAIGDYLRREVFAHGRRYHWDELSQRATGERLNPNYFVEQFVR